MKEVLKMAHSKRSCTSFNSCSTGTSTSGGEGSCGLSSAVSVDVASAFYPPEVFVDEKCAQRRSREDRRLKLPNAAVFLLGVCCVLPWDSLVADMNAFEHIYFPSYRWIETATQVRTLSLLFGHLLLLFLPPSLSLSSISVCCCCGAAAAACAVAASAPAAAVAGASAAVSVESSAFHFCCVMCGVLGFAAAAASSATFGVYMQQSLAYYWCLGKAVAGPLAAAAALLLHICCGGNSISSFVVKVDASEEEALMGAAVAAKKTRILMGICATWLLAGAVALAAALRTPAAAHVLLMLNDGSASEKSPKVLEYERDRQSVKYFALAQGCDEEAPLMGGSSNTDALSTEAALSTDSTRNSAKDQKCDFFLDVGDPPPCSVWSQWQGARIAAEEERSRPSLKESSRQHGCSLRIPLENHARLYGSVFRLIWTGLVCCFCLNLTSYLFFPITLQRMRPCSDGGPNSSAEYQLLLVGGYLLGVLVGRCCWSWICNTPPLLLPGLMLVRLLLLPLLFYLESLPGVLEQQSLFGPALLDKSSPAQVQLLLQSIDGLRWVVCFVFAAAHGYLSLVGLVAAAGSATTAAESAAAAALMTLAETLGNAAGAAVAAALVRTPWSGQWNTSQTLSAAASAATRLT